MVNTTLGIDIGGSAVKGALVNTDTGELASERIRKVTREPLKPKEIVGLIATIQKELKYTGPIGAGFPGIIRHGIVCSSANLHKNWVGEDLPALIRAKTGQQASAINDADAAGLAEMRFGIQEAHNYHVVLFLTIGTGIGSAIFLDGKLLPNTEFGHIEIRGKDAEYRASAAIKRIEKLSWKAWGERFTEVLKKYEFLCSPDLIILGGGVSARFDAFSKYLKVDTKVVPAKLQNLAGIIGAAMAAKESL
ncbi:MAG: ROK family protein [Anaerolineaceae bacterium]|mgnify:CR=1 FL=1|jgi:polyphosphate glucokinase|nr:ROK family protein [Anaerolineaceae bacterium]HNX45221.1 ROK family protein [Anaerolineaceae bacterium]HPT23322.1 ROK family protein [Anaerolineaceae bacterium]